MPQACKLQKRARRGCTVGHPKCHQGRMHMNQPRGAASAGTHTSIRILLALSAVLAPPPAWAAQGPEADSRALELQRATEPAILVPTPRSTPAVDAATGLPLPIVFDRKVLLTQSGATVPAPPPAVAAELGLKKSGPVWGQDKSYGIPALEIVGFDVLLNLFDRAYFGGDDFDVTRSSIRRNLRRGFGRDDDGFTVNQLGHPYQGSMYHGFARASGLNFWEGFAYAFVGSAAWEVAGETTRPSTNDQINTPIGGAFLGEALFRMSNLLLEQWQGPRLWREVAATAISPPVGFNRLAFGNRFDAAYPSNNAEYYSRIAVGLSSATQSRAGASSEEKRNEAVVDFSLDYGLPGNPGYAYRRPFDYFTFQASASSAVGFENVMTRGMLIGTNYELGRHYRGIWGLYGSYDYLAPQIFRMGSSGVSLGTTAEWQMTKSVSLQGTVLGGVGYTTVSTLRGLANDRDNHYGVAPQATLALRLIMADRASLDFSAREFFVSDVGGGRQGHDNIVRADTSFTWRISGPHAIAVKYQLSRRDASAPTLGDRSHQRGTVGIFYTLLGRDRFANVNWTR